MLPLLSGLVAIWIYLTFKGKYMLPDPKAEAFQPMSMQKNLHKVAGLLHP